MSKSLRRKVFKNEITLPDEDFRSIFQVSMLGICLAGLDGKILLANDQLNELLISKDEVIGKSIEELFFEEHTEDLLEMTQHQKLPEKIPIKKVLKLKHDRDEAIWVQAFFSKFRSENGTDYLLCQFQNISDLNPLSQTIEKHTLFLYELINHIPDNIFFKDRKSRFLLANHSTANDMGLSTPDDLIGKTDFEIHSKKMADNYFKDEQEIIATGEARLNIVEKVILSSGDIHWRSTSKLPLRNNEGQIIGIMGIGRDITNWVKEQKILKKAINDAKKADQLKSAFLANFSHEIRTPLNGILGFSQFLEKTIPTDHKAAGYISHIIDNGYKLLRIINDIIDISKLEAGQISLSEKAFSLNDLMDQLEIKTNQLKENAGKSHLIVKKSCALNDSNSYIISDDARLRQVMLNLLENAVKFTHAGVVALSYTINDNKIQFRVKDTGVGIEKEFLKHIFSTFRQADNTITRQYEGTGLGLAIAQGLAGLLGDQISVKSSPDEGSEFSFAIPYRKASLKTPGSTKSISKNVNTDVEL